MEKLNIFNNNENECLELADEEIKTFTEKDLINYLIESDRIKLYAFSRYTIVNKFILQKCLENRIVYREDFNFIIKSILGCDYESYDGDKFYLLYLVSKAHKKLSKLGSKKVKINLVSNTKNEDIIGLSKKDITWNPSDYCLYRDNSNEFNYACIEDYIDVLKKLGFEGNLIVSCSKGLNCGDNNYNLTNYTLYYEDCEINNFLLENVNKSTWSLIAKCPPINFNNKKFGSKTLSLAAISIILYSNNYYKSLDDITLFKFNQLLKYEFNNNSLSSIVNSLKHKQKFDNK